MAASKGLFFSKDELKFLSALSGSGIEFMIVGLSAATLQGAPVVTQDIDLWFKELPNKDLEKILKKFGASYIPPVMQRPPLLIGETIKLFDIVMHMHGLQDFDCEKENVITIDVDGKPLPVLSLERIIARKEALNREKDRLVLPVLRDTLVVKKSLETS